MHVLSTSPEAISCAPSSQSTALGAFAVPKGALCPGQTRAHRLDGLSLAPLGLLSKDNLGQELNDPPAIHHYEGHEGLNPVVKQSQIARSTEAVLLLGRPKGLLYSVAQGSGCLMLGNGPKINPSLLVGVLRLGTVVLQANAPVYSGCPNPFMYVGVVASAIFPIATGGQSRFPYAMIRFLTLLIVLWLGTLVSPQPKKAIHGKGVADGPLHVTLGGAIEETQKEHLEHQGRWVRTTSHPCLRLV